MKRNSKGQFMKSVTEVRMTKAQRRDQRVAAAIATGRKSSYEQRLEYAAKRPGLLGGVRPLIERLHPWDYAKLPAIEWLEGLSTDTKYINQFRLGSVYSLNALKC